MIFNFVGYMNYISDMPNYVLMLSPPCPFWHSWTNQITLLVIYPIAFCDIPTRSHFFPNFQTIAPKWSSVSRDFLSANRSWIYIQVWGTPKSFILMESSHLNHPFWVTPISGPPHINLLLVQATILPRPSPKITAWPRKSSAKKKWPRTYIPGWWFGCHFIFSHILGC